MKARFFQIKLCLIVAKYVAILDMVVILREK